MRRNDGFTLIEVMVALTIGAAIVLMVHQSFGVASDVVTVLAQRGRAHGTRMEARAYLTRAFESLEIGTPGSTGFEGSADRVRFSSRLDPSAPTPLTLLVQDQLLTVISRTGASRALDSASAVDFDYLLSYGAESRWVRGWHSPASAPLAVRMRLAQRVGKTDTLLFLIGPRG